MTSSESEGHAPSRKRSRKSNSAEEDATGGKKARGRPRVDTHDGTAADVSSSATPGQQQEAAECTLLIYEVMLVLTYDLC